MSFVLKKRNGVLMESDNKTRQSVIVLCCCIVCVITAVVCAVLFLSAQQKKDEKADNDRVVASVGKDKITESQFEFFAGLILNQEEDTVLDLYTSKDKSDKDELKKFTSNFINEYLVRVNEAKKAGVTLTEQELESLNKQFDEDYEKNKKTDEGELSKTDFYVYYYGITESQYKTFWKNWYIIDKHTSLLENNADIGEKAQQLAFQEYYDYLYSYTTRIIPLRVDAENTKGALIEKANNIVSQLKSGADFTTLLKENCNDNDLVEKNGLSEFYPVYKNDFVEMYDFVRTSEIGEIGVVSTDYDVYVVCLEGIKDFEKLKNTDEMIKWTRTFYVNKAVSDMLGSDEYVYKIEKDVYDAIDLGKLLTEAYEYWQSIWEEKA